jgi:hypothetical protein
MNPEFLRNVWLEMTTRRVLLMVGLLALTFAAAALGNDDWGPSAVAQVLYYVFVVIWGTRSAALSVVGEIGARTWDGQRLSSLGAGTMMWGKLFGATIYNWFGGAVCLAVIVVHETIKAGAGAAGLDLLYYLGIGVISQAAALLASLIAVGRGQGHSRFEVFAYQVVGLAAGLIVWWIWDKVRSHSVDTIAWWGRPLDASAFLLASLLIFSAWTLIACFREMRLELKMRNGPLVWLAFLLFIGVYVAGFDAWLSPELTSWEPVALRLLLAGTTYGVLTYIMVLLEPKDRVHYRWMQGQIRHGHIGNALNGAQAWMMSYAATVGVGGALAFWLLHDVNAAQVGQPLVLAALGFLTRDVSLFVLMQTLPGRRRGDFGALAILFALYVLIPWILISLNANSLLFLFFPQLPAPNFIGAIAAWVQGLAVAGFAFARLALTERDGTPVPA